VPRLRIDMEGWKEKTKARVEQTHILPVGSRQDTTLAVPVVSMDEQERQDLIDDAEDSLEELELKRKAEPQADQTGRKPKRLKMERLEGWGIGTSQVEGVENDGDVQLKDWKEATMSLPLEATQKRRQTSIQDWTRKRARIDDNEIVPEVRKVASILPKTSRKVKTGKLSKKEQRNMKMTHKDIGLLLAPLKPVEVQRHEDVLAKEVEDMEVVNEEREERLERVRRRALEWKSNHLCRQIILEQMEAAILEV
jgi:hypothetical protein